ncbi:MAG: HDOD domain-containing protein [Burkholderiales bacterium]|nr:HDOD domain-containing protein [Burkholderiales bacterium]
MIPIVPLLPIVDSSQKIVGLMPDIRNQDDVQIKTLIDFLGQLDFFEQLFPLTFFAPVVELATITGSTEYPPHIKNIVFCVPEAMCTHEDVQAQLHMLQRSGVRIIVDEFNSKSSLVWPDTKSVAVDCAQGLSSQVHPWIFSLSHGQHLARNVHTADDFAAAQSMGFSLFSGDFPFALSQKTKSDDPTSRSRLLKLLSLVANDAEVKELEALFKQDSALSFMLLKLVSSAAFAQTVKVTSFVQAINLLGRRQLQRWLQLLLYAQQGQHLGTALNPLMLRAAYRASMMEAICKNSGGDRDSQDGAFMVGMFSLLDLLFVAPLWEILQPLNLPDAVRAALIERTGDLGVCLKMVERSDRSDRDNLLSACTVCSCVPDSYYLNVMQAYTWVNQVCQEL